MRRFEANRLELRFVRFSGRALTLEVVNTKIGDVHCSNLQRGGDPG